MESKKGKIEFAKRKQTVQWPFGNIKQNLKHTEYYTRGQIQTTTESNLICISHNIKRLYNELNKKNPTKNKNQTHNLKTTKTKKLQKTNHDSSSILKKNNNL